MKKIMCLRKSGRTQAEKLQEEFRKITVVSIRSEDKTHE